MSGSSGRKAHISPGTAPPGRSSRSPAAMATAHAAATNATAHAVTHATAHAVTHAVEAHAATHPAASASASTAPPSKSKQPSLATLMMLKKKISDLRARQKRNRPVKRQENSYQLGPDPAKKYSVPGVKEIVDHSLQFFLGEARYDSKASPKLAKMVSEDIKRRMKNNFNCPRYKIVVMATVTQGAQQHLMMASRLLADSQTDDFVSCTLERPTFLACATAFWFYCE